MTMTEFFNNPVAVGMSLFGLLLLVGSTFSKMQARWERKHFRNDALWLKAEPRCFWESN